MTEAPQIEETFETEELITEDAVRDAQNGVFQTTLLERWTWALQNIIAATSGPLTLEVASQIITGYPWLRHSDLPKFRKDRVNRLEQALEVVIIAMDGKQEKLFKENEQDWKRHDELYIKILAGWNNLATAWEKEWQEQQPNRITHATIADVGGLLLSNEYGFVEQLQHLADFKIDKRLGKILGELTGTQIDIDDEPEEEGETDE